MRVGVPFVEGYVLAADATGTGRIHKLPWGLVAAPRGLRSDGAWRALAEGDEPTVAHLVRRLSLLAPQAETSWLFTLEPRLRVGPFEGLVPPDSGPGRLAGPVEGYRLDGIDLPGEPPGAPRRLGWGGVIADPGDDRDLVREAGLVLQEGLDAGSGLDERIGAVLRAFARLGERLPDFSPDVDVGLHESDRRFSVDRIAWSVVG